MHLSEVQDWRLAGILPPHELAFMKKEILRGWKRNCNKGWQAARHLPPTQTRVSLLTTENYPEAKEAIPAIRQCCSVCRDEIKQCREAFILGKKLGWQYALATRGSAARRGWRGLLGDSLTAVAPAAVAVSRCCPQVALQSAHMLKGRGATNQITPGVNQTDELLRCMQMGAWAN